MARLAWFDLNDEIFRVGLSRLSQMTNESTEPVRVGLFVSGTTIYDLPFYGCRDLTMFYDDNEQGAGVATLMRGTGADGQDQVLLNAPPGPSGVMLSAQTASGVLTAQLLWAIRKGQGLVSDAMVARGYSRPAVDAANASDTMKGMAWTVAEWNLVMSIKRAPLGDALRTIDIAYQEVVGLNDRDHKSQDIEGHYHNGQLWWAAFDWELAPISTIDDGTGMILSDRRVFKERPI